MKAFVVAVVIVVAAHAARAQGPAVVTDGRFTNIYIVKDPLNETWESVMAKFRPGDAAQFSRAAIDEFTDRMLDGRWPSYFDALSQFGIHPPRFFGSGVAGQKCIGPAITEALKTKGVIQFATARALANCHNDGMDPSPQVNLIFSPEFTLADFGDSGDMCTQKKKTTAYHSGGLYVPNFTVIPTSTRCHGTFASLTTSMTHEWTELLTDPLPGGLNAGADEVADICKTKQGNPEGLPSTTQWKGFTVAKYFSKFDAQCAPLTDPPAGSVSEIWVLGENTPLKGFTGDVHNLVLNLPANRVVTTAEATQVRIIIQTGGDDLRAGSSASDNADVTLAAKTGSQTTNNINDSRNWKNGETHTAVLKLPAHVKVDELSGVTISTHFTGGCCGDNWNVDKVALQVSFPAGSKTTAPPPAAIVHRWLDVSDLPLVRFTGKVHELEEKVTATDPGKPISALELVISTGNDDLRAGSICDVEVDLKSGSPIVVNDANRSQNWKGWTDHAVAIPLPKGGLSGGDITKIKLRTRFGGGSGGDNWNVERLQLRATLK